ncbi:hypothetical protein PS2_024431 [Malus domestica]
MRSMLISFFPTCALFTRFHIFHRGYRLPYGHQRRWAWPFHLLQPQHNNNAQGGQSKASVATINTKDSSIASAQHGGVQNGARVQPQLHGGSDAPIASMLPGQLKLQPHKEAPELFQRLRLLKNTHYTSEGIIDKSTKKAAVVDPVEPEKVLKAAQEHGVSIKLILTTCHYCTFQKWIYGDLYLSWVHDADSYSRKNDPRS